MSGSTYYDYKDVKVLIAHRLFKMDGWKVYGYHANNSDPYTDYYDPANWGGIATKNGYTLVIDKSWAEEEHRHTYTVKTEYNAETAAKIAKLEKMTQANGASEQEEQTAQAAILKLMEKQTATEITKEDYTPGHMANPPRCNWHIEKDGIIYDKGTGLLKFASLPDITYDYELKQWQDYNNQTAEEWKKDYKELEMRRWNESEERAQEMAESAYKSVTEKYKLLEQFNILINRFNAIAGGMVGNAGENGYKYEMRKVTKYKTVYKFVEDPAGSFKEGQCFKLLHSFNYGCFAGYVYKFVDAYQGTRVRGQRVSLKSNKVLTGTANRANSFGYYVSENDPTPDATKEKFLKWIESGAIAWGHIEEVQEPYEVEKAVKVREDGTEYKTPKTEPQEAQEAPGKVNYIITPDKDTRDNSDLFVVTLSERVSAEEFNKIRDYIKTVGGYYSRFKRGFIFKEDPTSILNQEEPTTETTEAPQEANEQPTEETPQETKEPIKYGYTGPSSDFFTTEDLQTLTNGGQVGKGEGWQKKIYIATPYQDSILFVYGLGTGNTGKLSPTQSGSFAGFIYNNVFYDDFEVIKEKAYKDVNSELVKLIPNQEAAEANAAGLEEYEQKQIDDYKTYDYFSRESKKHFIEDTRPKLYLYTHNIELDSYKLIDYIVNPAEVVQTRAAEYITSWKAEILKCYIHYNKVTAGIKEIAQDPNNQLHQLKKIKKATAGEQKSFKILLKNGHAVKVEARAVHNLAYSEQISSFYVNCSDRQYLNLNSYGRPEDIKPADIVSISYGQKTLYTA